MFSNTVSLGVLSCVCLAVALNPLEGAPPQSVGISSASLRMPLDRPPVLLLTTETRGDIYMARKMYRDAIDMYRLSPVNAPIMNKIGIAFQEMSQIAWPRNTTKKPSILIPIIRKQSTISERFITAHIRTERPFACLRDP